MANKKLGKNMKLTTKQDRSTILNIEDQVIDDLSSDHH